MKTDATALRLAVRTELDVAGVVGRAVQFCTGHRLSPLLTAHVATAASELANNLWMHATAGGVLCLALVERQGGAGIELVAEDEGPGIADVAEALREGFSTAGSLGIGLPGVRRLMDEFRIEPVAGGGTRILTRKWQEAQ